MTGIKDVLSGTHAGHPVWEILDLDVDGSTPTIVPAQKSYTYIERIIWLLYFSATSLDWEKFANDTALTNGLSVMYNGENISSDHTIGSNEDFHIWGYDVAVQSDDISPKNRVLTARWTFSKSIPHGLGMWYGQQFGIRVADDMTALTSIIEFHVAIQGWKLPT